MVDSGIGPLLLAATDKGLVGVVFHAKEAVRDRALARIAERLGGPELVERASGRLAEPIRMLDAYFAGVRELRPALDWSPTGGFNRQVLRELAAVVPYGRVVGYGDLAARVGQPGAAQAVGAAMGANPPPDSVRGTPGRWWCRATGWWRATADWAASAGAWRRSGGC